MGGVGGWEKVRRTQEFDGFGIGDHGKGSEKEGLGVVVWGGGVEEGGNGRGGGGGGESGGHLLVSLSSSLLVACWCGVGGWDVVLWWV